MKNFEIGTSVAELFIAAELWHQHMEKNNKKYITEITDDDIDCVQKKYDEAMKNLGNLFASDLRDQLEKTLNNRQANN